MRKMVRPLLSVGACLVVLGHSVAMSGCVRRTIVITSDPAGALVYLNDQEVGRTPVEVDFLYYGDYDVRLVLDGYEPLTTMGRARAPLWDSVPLDLFAEAIPGEPHSRVEWHYDLAPASDAAEGMFERALGLRQRLRASGPRGGEAPAADGTQSADTSGGSTVANDADRVDGSR